MAKGLISCQQLTSEAPVDEGVGFPQLLVFHQQGLLPL
jgi:hypothetical protein